MIKVAILGPESTGKSSLAAALSNHFNAPWVPEYAREYVEKLSDPYTYEDVCRIAQHQIAQEDEYRHQSGNYVFFDTDLIITAVWLEYCYGNMPDFVQQRLSENYFDLYLLCNYDLPWEPDPVREHGTDREYFFEWYRREIEKTGRPYFIINGANESRLQCALKALEHFENRQ